VLAAAGADSPDMTLRRCLPAVAALAALALGATACGSSSETATAPATSAAVPADPATAPAPPATTGFHGAVLEVEAAYLDELQAKQDALTAALTAGDDASALPLLDFVATSSTALADQIAALEPPADQQTLAATLVASYRDMATHATAARRALDASDMDAFVRALDGYTAAQDASRKAVADLAAAR
jgi:predicted component of type VI protein secretion system